MAEVKRGPGQPTSYRPEYCQVVIELGKKGKSKVQMCAHFSISRQTIDNWAHSNPEFLEALNVAMVHCQDWWENAGMNGMFMNAAQFNAAIWKKSMEARFREDYTEQKAVALSGEVMTPAKMSEISDEMLAAIVAGVKSK